MQHTDRNNSGVDFEMVGIRLGELVFLTIAGEYSPKSANG